MKRQIFRTADQKEFIDLFDGLCMRRHAWQAWGDFVEASAIAVSSSCDKVSPDRGKREERYRRDPDGRCTGANTDTRMGEYQ